VNAKFRHGLSLRARVTSWYIGLLAVTLVLFSVAVYAGIHSYLKSTLQRGLQSTAETIAQTYLAHIPEKGQRWALGEIRESYDNGASDRFVRISTDGTVLYKTGDMRDPTIRIDDLPIPAIAAAFHSQKTYHQDVTAYTLPFYATDGRVILVEAGASLDAMQQTLHSLAETLSITTPLVLLIATIGGYWLMKRPLRPLVVLTDKAEDVGRKQLGERLPVIPTGDELERLTHALNRMIGRLEESLAHNYRFSADASHELRTPLTIMRGELEEMVQLANLPPQAVENLVSTLDEIDRMSRIVNSLMTITRLDSGGERMDLVPVDIAALTRTTMDHMRLLAVERGIPLTLEAPGSLFVQADAMRMKQVLVNLIDNAIKYTPANDEAAGDAAGGVHVSLEVSGEQVVLQVADHGIGIATAVIPHVFERFYRADYARNRVAGGVGLGLAIVKTIITAHNGEVFVRSVEGQGTTISVHLPLLSAEAASMHVTGTPTYRGAPPPGSGSRAATRTSLTAETMKK